ncbi:hypothetical protein D2Q93_16050 [Alicyclobacillaceae bacterium I2511]|nr:hypothetical protein D2Q93_16050 [Alicyclobacillaceae bacterium I2511]
MPPVWRKFLFANAGRPCNRNWAIPPLTLQTTRRQIQLAKTHVGPNKTQTSACKNSKGMLAMNEQDFLQNVAQRLGRSHPMTQPPQRQVVGAPEFWTQHVEPLQERIEHFLTAFTALGGDGHVFDTLAGLQQGLSHLLSQLQPKQIATWGDGLAEFGVTDVLAAYPQLQWGQVSVADVSRADVGLTGCSYAIADTGTLVFAATPTHGRGVHLLPTVHIALLKASQVRTRLGEVLSETELSTYLHFVSGPSRSSDIENDQSIGVHGPAAMFALMWKDI